MIRYTAGYKYQLTAGCSFCTDLRPHGAISGEYISLSTSGVIDINKGYAWDGPSGPTIDTRNFMRGSLVHDALYQLIREGKLPQSERERADQELRKMCKEDGMSAIRAWWVYRGVRLGGAAAASPKNIKEVLTAP